MTSVNPNAGGLLECLGIKIYDPNQWRLFIDSSKRSLKCVLLHNGNKYGSVPLAHSTTMKEKYEEIMLVLEKINYKDHTFPQLSTFSSSLAAFERLQLQKPYARR